MRICGLDEAGRGALAGPLVAVAVVLSPKSKILSSKQILNDSKKLNPKQRTNSYKAIIDSGVEYAVEIISARQINNRGIGWANKEIFRRLIRKIKADKYIVDGNLQFTMKNVRIRHVIKADQTRKCVMAASIIAKVTRDRLMNQLHIDHPNYAWDENAGYGTKKHIEAIRVYGEVRYHRTVYVTTALSRNNAL